MTKTEYDLIEFIRSFKACGIDSESAFKSAKIEFGDWHTDEAISAVLRAWYSRLDKVKTPGKTEPIELATD